MNPRWRSDLAKESHPYRHCIATYSIDSLSGSISLNRTNYYQWDGCLSKSLYYLFDRASSYHDPNRATGYEIIYLGIGRYYDKWTGMRPYKLSDAVEIQVQNNIG